MDDLSQLIPKLGGLHDARLSRLMWQWESRRLDLSIDDLHANFEGLPEYPGPRPAVIVFRNVIRLDVQVDLAEAGLMLYECVLKSSGGAVCTTEISFSPGGWIRIESDAPSLAA